MIYKATITLFRSDEGGRQNNAAKIYVPHIQFYDGMNPPLRLINGRLTTISNQQLLNARFVVEDIEIQLGKEYSCVFEFVNEANTGSPGQKFIICEMNHVVGIGKIIEEFPTKKLEYQKPDNTELARKLNQFLDRFGVLQNDEIDGLNKNH